MDPDDILEGWNAIAGFLRCDVRTAKRWETKRGMPVRRTWRIHGEGRPNVYAVTAELRTWKAAADAAARSQREAASVKRLPAAVALPEVPRRGRFGWGLRVAVLALFVVSIAAAAAYVVKARGRNARPREFASPACSSGPNARR